MWIGATDNQDEGNWVDSLGKPLEFTNWHSSEPNNLGWYDSNGEDYGSIQFIPGNESVYPQNGTWIDLGKNPPNSDHAFSGIAEIQLDPNNAPTGEPKIKGKFRIGETLTADISNISDADNFQGWTPTYKYSWKSSSDNQNWTEISNSTTYKITAEDKGKNIKLDVSYMDGYGTIENLSSQSGNVPNPVIRGNSIYSISDGSSWNTTKTNAEKVGGHLATLSSGEENRFVFENFGIDKSTNKTISSGYWIGLTDQETEGQWKDQWREK